MILRILNTESTALRPLGERSTDRSPAGGYMAEVTADVVEGLTRTTFTRRMAG
jgi:hypothetical protein